MMAIGRRSIATAVRTDRRCHCFLRFSIAMSKNCATSILSDSVGCVSTLCVACVQRLYLFFAIALLNQYVFALPMILMTHCLLYPIGLGTHPRCRHPRKQPHSIHKNVDILYAVLCRYCVIRFQYAPSVLFHRSWWNFARLTPPAVW